MRAPTKKELAAAPRHATAVQVIAGLVWEHDVDEAGFATSGLRPHYKPGAPGYPKDGYPDPKVLRALMAETAARERADRAEKK